MRKILLICLAIFLTACTAGHGIEHDVHIPQVVITDTPLSITPVVETPVVEEVPVQGPPQELDVPQFNEYIISMEFEPETRIVRGIESIRYTNRNTQALDELVFRVFLSYMDIHHIFLDNEELDFNLSGTVLTVNLPRNLEPDETLQIHLQFEAYIPTGTDRVGANDQVIWAGAFFPVEAVLGSRGWHTESYYSIGSPFILDVANYFVEITTPVDYVVAGTGTKTENIVDGKKVTSFTAPMVRDFAFAISPYFEVTTITTYSDREIRLYHYTPNLPVEHILDVAAEAMTIFEEAVGAYPFPQLSIVETSIFRAGESFSNMIFIDGSPLRITNNLADLRHGIGRQWFSIIIGNNLVDEAWLSGGLSLLVQEGLLGKSDELQLLMGREHSYLDSWQHLIFNENSRRINSRISDYQNWTDYIRIQYRKSRLMFYALYLEMGYEAFNDLLREYFRQYAFQIATAEDFINLAEELHGSELGEFFNNWLNTTDLPEFSWLDN